eukprot:scaffold102670_cov27-Phaeocystis_antarctica.AAC.2
MQWTACCELTCSSTCMRRVVVGVVVGVVSGRGSGSGSGGIRRGSSSRRGRPPQPVCRSYIDTIHMTELYDSTRSSGTACYMHTSHRWSGTACSSAHQATRSSMSRGSTEASAL